MAAVAAGDGPFRWKDLDERLVSPKLNKLTEEMHRRATEAEHQIASETAKNGNSARYVPQFLRFHEQLSDEWAARAYVVYCDAWNEQRRAVSPSFIRAVRDNAIIPLTSTDKLFWLLLHRFWSSWKTVLIVVSPDTVVCWHRAGFQLYWRLISRVRRRVGRRPVSKEIRELIFKMMTENLTLRAPRIHGELVMLGFDRQHLVR